MDYEIRPVEDKSSLPETLRTAPGKRRRPTMFDDKIHDLYGKGWHRFKVDDIAAADHAMKEIQKAAKDFGYGHRKDKSVDEDGNVWVIFLIGDKRRGREKLPTDDPDPDQQELPFNSHIDNSSGSTTDEDEDEDEVEYVETEDDPNRMTPIIEDEDNESDFPV